VSQPIVFWSGPVAAFQIPGATIPGATDVFMGCRGDQGPHPYCPSIGEQLRRDPSLLLQRAGQPELGELYAGAFSAGGSVLKRMLEEDPWRRSMTAVHLADATWTSGVLPAPAIEGFVRYGVDVAQGSGDQLFIATASPIPNQQWATGHANLDAIQREIEARTGMAFQRDDQLFAGVDGELPVVHRLGNVIFAKFPLEPYGHAHTKAAPFVWKSLIQPWVAKGKGPIDAPGPIDTPPPPGVPPVHVGPPAASAWVRGLAGVIGLALGATVGAYVGRRWGRGA
jgi:hypothetical protein